MSPELGLRKLRIGELLVANQIITREQLETALIEQKKLGHKLGRTLVELGYVEQDQLLEFLARQLRIPIVSLGQLKPDPDVVRMLPETHARRFRAVVLEDRGHELLIGMADPADLFAFDELSRLLKRRLKPAVVRERELLELIDRSYRRSEEISSLAEELHEDLGETSFDLDRLAEDLGGSEAPVVRLLQSIFEDAVKGRASDIHIEPDEHVLRIRQRIDGLLREQEMPERRIAPALVLRLKLMASLDISEKRLPQDGRFQIVVAGRSIDVRLSTMPVQYGESVVMRLLDQSGGVLHMDQLGMPPRLLTRLQHHIHQTLGLVLVTGPTGSGKTTTLYAALSELNRASSKIITVEDPVEYRLPRINQVQVSSKIDLSFARVLRTALRQDPDILMVGEMRDPETVEMALRGALTGHLVLSTLHTNHSVASAARLIDLGASPALLATALRCIVAQRLVRLVCPECTEPHEPDERERAWLDGCHHDLARARFQSGVGCNRCNATGYRGRTGIYEFLELDGPAAYALGVGDLPAFERAARSSAGFRPLVDSALAAAVAGRTTLAEVLRVAGETGTEE
ncbi:MAG: GspE/PulE family protein [Myxococcota bacterium]